MAFLRGVAVSNSETPGCSLQKPSQRSQNRVAPPASVFRMKNFWREKNFGTQRKRSPGRQSSVNEHRYHPHSL